MPKKIIIIGDSWGIGAYQYAYGSIEPIPNTGIDYFLTQLGYNVVNLSVSGGSNIEQFNKLNNVNADLIIWFHTETNRDLFQGHVNANSFEELTSLAAEHNYKRAQQIFDEHHIPFIVVGCLSPLHPSINRYTFYTYKIHSWLGELGELVYPLPLNTHCNNMYKVLSKFSISDKQFVIDQIDKMLVIETNLEKHQSFSDGVHPSENSFLELATRLHLIIASNN